MTRKQKEEVAVFDRFGWYWQPSDWLQQMSARDAIKATEQAINIQFLKETLLLQVDENEAQATEQLKILKQRFNLTEND